MIVVRDTEHVLLPLLTDLFHLFLSDGVTPHLWNRVKFTPLHKKRSNYVPKNYRLLAINGCIYILFANVVRDLLTDWALAEHQIPDSQFDFCPTKNTIQPSLFFATFSCTQDACTFSLMATKFLRRLRPTEA